MPADDMIELAKSLAGQATPDAPTLGGTAVVPDASAPNVPIAGLSSADRMVNLAAQLAKDSSTASPEAPVDNSQAFKNDALRPVGMWNSLIAAGAPDAFLAQGMPGNNAETNQKLADVQDLSKSLPSNFKALGVDKDARYSNPAYAAAGGMLNGATSSLPFLPFTGPAGIAYGMAGGGIEHAVTDTTGNPYLGAAAGFIGPLAGGSILNRATTAYPSIVRAAQDLDVPLTPKIVRDFLASSAGEDASPSLLQRAGQWLAHPVRSFNGLYGQSADTLDVAGGKLGQRLSEAAADSSDTDANNIVSPALSKLLPETEDGSVDMPGFLANWRARESAANRAADMQAAGYGSSESLPKTIADPDLGITHNFADLEDRLRRYEGLQSSQGYDANRHAQIASDNIRTGVGMSTDENTATFTRMAEEAEAAGDPAAAAKWRSFIPNPTPEEAAARFAASDPNQPYLPKGWAILRDANGKNYIRPEGTDPATINGFADIPKDTEAYLGKIANWYDAYSKGAPSAAASNTLFEKISRTDIGVPLIAESLGHIIHPGSPPGSVAAATFAGEYAGSVGKRALGSLMRSQFFLKALTTPVGSAPKATSLLESLARLHPEAADDLNTVADSLRGSGD